MSSLLEKSLAVIALLARHPEGLSVSTLAGRLGQPASGVHRLLRELARMGNNLNQLARAANRRQPVPAAALLVRLIEIDRELSALRAAHERPADAD